MRAQSGTPDAHASHGQVTFGVWDDYYPYSFRDSHGNLVGFSIDLANALARVMNLKAKWDLLPGQRIQQALADGTIDAIPFIAETDQRRATIDFSVPVLQLELVAIVRKDDPRIHTLGDLEGMRIAVGHGGTVGEAVLARQFPRATPVYTRTNDEFLRMLSDGKCDAAIMSRLTALSIIDRIGLKNLAILDARFPGYDIRWCFGVRKGNTVMLARINEGLAILHRSGEFDQIYRKTFGRYQKYTLTWAQMATCVAAALGIGCAAATVAFFRQRALVGRIARQSRELTEQRALLAALFENHPLATLVLEIPEGRPPWVVSINHEAERLFTLDSELVHGRDVASLPLHTDHRRYLEELFTRWMTEKRSFQVEVRLKSSQHLLDTVVLPLGLGASGNLRICVLAADVTRRRTMDQEVAQARRVRALGELVGGIAHEFNNLLTPILATVNLLRIERAADTSLVTDLSLVEQASLRAADLTRRLLTFGQKKADNLETVVVAEVVDNCVSLTQSTIDRRIEFKRNLPADLPPLLLSATDVNQIIFNLVINSRDALVEQLSHPPDPGWVPRLTVSASQHPASALSVRAALRGRALVGWVALEVEDNGQGIPPDIIDRIFDPFFTTKEVGKGTGLGLATVWHLVSEMGGTVTVDSKPGIGTRFVVMLPRWSMPGPSAAGAAPVAGSPASGGGVRSVLILEDDTLVGQAVASIVRKLGHRVTLATDGISAWQTFSASPGAFDVLMADLNVPKLNGVDFLRRVLDAGYAGRVIVMSGHMAGQELAAVRNMKVHRILSKPFTQAEVIEGLA